VGGGESAKKKIKNTRHSAAKEGAVSFDSVVAIGLLCTGG